MAVAQLPLELPVGLRESEHWTLVDEPPGLFIVATGPLECPGCHTARCFFFIDRPPYKPLRYRCLGCSGGIDAAKFPSTADVATSR